MSVAKKLVAGIEIGGTTSAVAISDRIGNIIWKKKGIPTGRSLTPEQAIDGFSKVLKESGYNFEKIGIASFGPLDLKKGTMGNTPKPGWGKFPLVDAVQKRFPGKKIILETDVNAPAFCEYVEYHKEDPSITSLAYITIGTGVGLGLYSDNKLYHGAMHPEFGHIKIHKRDEDKFQGTCPFHGDCIEGLCSSGGISKRLGIQPDDIRHLPQDHPVWEIYADYVGQSAASAALAYSLDAFVIGGGITTGDGRDYLYPKIQEYCNKYLNGYIKPPRILKPHYGKDAGLMGACAIAFQ